MHRRMPSSNLVHATAVWAHTNEMPGLRGARVHEWDGVRQCRDLTSETRAERLLGLHMYGGCTDRRLMEGEVILTHRIRTCMYLSAVQRVWYNISSDPMCLLHSSSILCCNDLHWSLTLIVTHMLKITSIAVTLLGGWTFPQFVQFFDLILQTVSGFMLHSVPMCLLCRRYI